MKRLRVSSLMDEYTDTEFFPTGGSAVNSEAVKDRVMAQAKAEAPTRRKQKMPRKKKILLAAALAAAMVLLTAAGYPLIQHRLVGGTLSFKQRENEKITAFVHNTPIAENENGRLIFNRDDGQRVDITDLVSEETPYIYDASDPDTGMVYYIVMGGTPESFGWFEWIQVPYPFDERDSDVSFVFNYDEDGNPVEILFDFVLDNPEHNRHSVGSFGTVYLDDAMKLPWLLAGAEQLGITFEEPPEHEIPVVNDVQS